MYGAYKRVSLFGKDFCTTYLVISFFATPPAASGPTPQPNAPPTPDSHRSTTVELLGTARPAIGVLGHGKGGLSGERATMASSVRGIGAYHSSHR